MTPVLFQSLILAVGASKVVAALVFFAWIETHRAQPQAQAIEYHVQNQRSLTRVP